MANKRIDMSVRFSGMSGLPEEREIEVAQVNPLPEKAPPTQMVQREPYLADDKLIEAVNLAIALGRPLLLQGPPGCGKTRLPHAVAYALSLPLEIAYIKSISQAQELFYTYDAIKRLYDAQLGAEGEKDEQGAPLAREVRHYIRLGPLGRAIKRATFGRRSVVLIDEIDKADIDFPNDLLWELDRLAFRVAEAPDIQYKIEDPALRPIVFITNNEEKVLPTAFLRRCIFHYIEFPTNRQRLEGILALHEVTDKALTAQAIEVVLQLRKLDLSKKPGLSELIDWAGYLQAVQEPPSKLQNLPYIGTLLKQRQDQSKALKELGRE